MSSPNADKMAELENKLDRIIQYQLESQANFAKIDAILSVQNEISSKLETVFTEITTIKDRTHKLESSTNIINQELIDLRNNSSDLINKVNHIEQQNLANSFIITGLPVNTESRDLTAFFQKFGENIGEKIEENDLQSCFISKNRYNNSSQINGKFYDIRKKEKVFQLFKQKKPIVIEDVCSVPDDSPLRGKEILLKNQLTSYKKKLLYETRMLATNYKFIWENNGRILIKMNENSPVKEITSYQHLQEILNK
jgi:hypothetical protein